MHCSVLSPSTLTVNGCDDGCAILNLQHVSLCSHVCNADRFVCTCLPAYIYIWPCGNMIAEVAREALAYCNVPWNDANHRLSSPNPIWYDHVACPLMLLE